MPGISDVVAAAVVSEISVRSCQEYLADHRRARRAAEVATVRFETAPGHQMQIDFGQKRVRIAVTPPG